MGCAKDDGFVPFDPLSGHTLSEGDTVRLREAVVVRSVYYSLGTVLINIGGISVALTVGAIAAVRKKPPEPLKVGDIVRHTSWAHGERAEIAGVKDGLAAFWGLESGTQYVPRPRPLSELERVK